VALCLFIAAEQDVLAVYDHYYPLSKSKDLAFEVGRLFMAMKVRRDLRQTNSFCWCCWSFC
jgi:hypothetical protein